MQRRGLTVPLLIFKYHKCEESKSRNWTGSNEQQRNEQIISVGKLKKKHDLGHVETNGKILK